MIDLALELIVGLPPGYIVASVLCWGAAFLYGFLSQ